MKIEHAIICFITGILLSPMAAHASGPEPDPTYPKTFVSNPAITSKIKSRLVDEKNRSLARIGVDTRANGEVLLSGKVATQEEADQAVSIARETEGVTSVRSTIQLKKND